jgi:hypothetical protein
VLFLVNYAYDSNIVKGCESYHNKILYIYIIGGCMNKQKYNVWYEDQEHGDSTVTLAASHVEAAHSTALELYEDGALADGWEVKLWVSLVGSKEIKRYVVSAVYVAPTINIKEV